MKKIGLMSILLAGLIIGLWGAGRSQAQMDTMGTSYNEMMGNQVIHDEGYGNADTEYYGSKDDLVNDDLNNEEK
jgi:hypothetical protein